MKIGCGHPMGPLALCDLIGLDVLYSVCDSPYVGVQARRARPAPADKRTVASGRRNVGRGFCEY